MLHRKKLDFHNIASFSIWVGSKSLERTGSSMGKTTNVHKNEEQSGNSLVKTDYSQKIL